MNIVNNLSFRFGIVRAAIIAGIAHANPESIGTNDLPFKPIFESGLSMSISPHERYPESSNKPRIKKSIIICGTKINTEPAPEIIPSETKLVNQPGLKLSTTSVFKVYNSSSTRSINGCAIQKIVVKVTPITRIKIANPQKR